MKTQSGVQFIHSFITFRFLKGLWEWRSNGERFFFFFFFFSLALERRTAILRICTHTRWSTYSERREKATRRTVQYSTLTLHCVDWENWRARYSRFTTGRACDIGRCNRNRMDRISEKTVVVIPSFVRRRVILFWLFPIRNAVMGKTVTGATFHHPLKTGSSLYVKYCYSQTLLCNRQRKQKKRSLENISIDGPWPPLLCPTGQVAQSLGFISFTVVRWLRISCFILPISKPPPPPPAAASKEKKKKEGGHFRCLFF